MNKKLAVLVSNPCNKDARVLKAIDVAKKQNFKVKVFCVTSADVPSYEAKDGVEFIRSNWNPVDTALNLTVFSLIAKFSIKLAKAIIVAIMPYLKYSLFKKIFADGVIDFQPDIIHSHDFICLPTASYVSKITGCKLIYDAHELEVHRNPPLPFFRKRYVGWLEKRCAKRADAIITVGENIANILSRSFKKKVHVVFNSPRIEPINRNIREDLQLDDETPVMLYVGKVTVGRGVEEILSLMTTLPGVVFAAVGPCDQRSKEKLYKMAERLKISQRFRILPPVHYTKVVSYISGADVGLLSVMPVTLSYELCMPNKLFEMTFAEVPILANDLTEVRELITKLGNGRVLDFSVPEQLPGAITEIIAKKSSYIANLKKESSQSLLKSISWENQEKLISDIYQDVLR
ncbi:MAG: glycosyltransferase [Alteromonadaceae bacterium]|nr:glycosyltransferase [Alteromonadaceae bacterium]